MIDGDWSAVFSICFRGLIRMHSEVSWFGVEARGARVWETEALPVWLEHDAHVKPVISRGEILGHLIEICLRDIGSPSVTGDVVSFPHGYYSSAQPC